MTATLSAADLAETLGRSADWLYDNWRRLCEAEKMPKPLHGGATPLTWSRAHIHAWLDRDLPRETRLAAAAIRAAEAAAAGARLLGPHERMESDARAYLDEKFGPRFGPLGGKP